MFVNNDYTGRIVFDKDRYQSEEEMWAAVSQQIKILTENNYQVLFTADDPSLGIYILDFAHDPDSDKDDWGCDRFMLVTADEEDEILFRRNNPELKEEE